MEEGGGRRRRGEGRRREAELVPEFDWFFTLLGFAECGHEQVQEQLEVAGEVLISKVTGKRFQIGDFKRPSLQELREEARAKLSPDNIAGIPGLHGAPRVEHALGDVADLHANPANRHATFQVASQFNCLEFVGPDCTPEMGVACYERDKTQGPCCSIACGAATAYRNYLVPVTGKDGATVVGQRRDCQLENLHDLSEAVGNVPTGRFFVIEGGYTLAESNTGLTELNRYLHDCTHEEREELKGKLRVGVQDGAQVTSSGWGKQLLDEPDQVVTQVFGSACSVSYSRNGRDLWEPFAKLVLEASYEATLLIAGMNAVRHQGKHGSSKVFLTSLGGGAFGNSVLWIEDAAREAINRVCKNQGLRLEVFLVSYMRPESHFQNLVNDFAPRWYFWRHLSSLWSRLQASGESA